MLTGSAVDLYTTLLGWHLYNGIWSLLSATGIALIPFIVMVLKTLLEVQEKEGITAKQVVRTLEVRFYLMLAVLFFGVQPVLNIYTQKTTYKTLECSPSDLSYVNGNAGFGATGTTFDQQATVFKGMIDSSVARAPFWWFFMAPLNQAVTYALKHELPCKPDVRAMLSDLSTLNVTDPQLQAETAQFYNECYLPASNKFMRENPTIPSAIPNPSQDVAWMGSEFFITQPGYYDQLRPMVKPVSAIGYCELCGDNVKGPDLTGNGFGGPGPGWPTCDQWWKGRGGDDGLRKRVLWDMTNSASLPHDEGLTVAQRTNFEQVTKNWYSPGVEQQDALLKTVLGSAQKRAALPVSSDLTPAVSAVSLSQTGESLKSTAANLGIMWGSIGGSVKSNAIRSAAPIVQALVLMMLTLLLPLLMMFSLYNVGKLLQLTLVHFSIVFWSFLFALASWLDNFLLAGIFNVTDHSTLSMDNMQDSTTKLVIGYITMFLYIALPVLFTSMMGIVGGGLAIGITESFNMATHGLGDAAAAPAKAAQGAATSLVKKIK